DLLCVNGLCMSALAVGVGIQLDLFLGGGRSGEGHLAGHRRAAGGGGCRWRGGGRGGRLGRGRGRRGFLFRLLLAPAGGEGGDGHRGEQDEEHPFQHENLLRADVSGVVSTAPDGVNPSAPVRRRRADLQIGRII